MSNTYRIVSPVDGRILAERPYLNTNDAMKHIHASRIAQRMWKQTPLAERIAIGERFVEAMLAMQTEIAEELTLQMGRPLSQSPGELRGFAERARYMLRIAPTALADEDAGSDEQITRFLRRDPMGVVFVIAAWNYPYLIAVNSVLPAIIAGNSVILKHAAQTALVADRFAQAFAKAGLPRDVFQIVDISHETAAHMIGSGQIDFVSFTGSVSGGHAIARAAAETFIGVALELGGKDPAYVRADADLESAVATVVDGALFNSGQCCCGIERVYVHESKYQQFMDAAVAMVNAYKLGNPLELTTNLGPVVTAKAAQAIRAQVNEAITLGATPLIDPSSFQNNALGTPYLAPQILTHVNHTMPFMREETFGPCFGIMSVKSDEEAIALMNDSHYGLTASIFTQDESAAKNIGRMLETGTVFMNRCDHVDPHLAWTGVKDSGRGVALSHLGYHQLTRAKSFHLKH